jgi:hypothetical protein
VKRLQRKDLYTPAEAAHLLGVKRRTVVALNDAALLAAQETRLASGRTQLRFPLGEIIRFNATRPAAIRANLAERLADPTPDHPQLAFMSEPDPAPDGDSVWLTEPEIRHLAALVHAIAESAAGNQTTKTMKAVERKIGPAGADVIAKGLRVYQGGIP